MQMAADFWMYVNVVRKRLWLIALLFVTTVGVILAISQTAKRVYRASVRLQVLPTDRTEVTLFAATRTTSTMDEVTQAQSDFMRAMKSGYVSWKTIADLNLNIGALDLISAISFAAEGDFIIATVESDEPGRAEAIVTTQVNNALENYRGVRATPSRVLRDFVSQMLASESQSMVNAEKALLDFKVAHGFDSISQETRALQDAIRNLKVERDRTVMEREKAAIFADTYRDQQKKMNDAADTLQSISDPAKPGQEVAPYTTKYYRDLALQHGMTAVEWEAKRDGLAKSIEIYDRMIDERSAELRALLGLYSEYSALDREVTRATNNYNFLRDKDNEARLRQAQAEKLGYIQITEPARKPDAPVPTKTLQLVAVGGAVSILAGLVLAFILEFLSSLRKVSQRQRVS